MRGVLLVGGAGYVGSVLAQELLGRGYAVRILDRLYYGAEGLSGIGHQIELVREDIRCLAPDVLGNVDAVINVAGLSNDPTAEYNPEANHEINTVASCKLADLCKQQGVRRYIFASSCSIYDRGSQSPQEDELHDEESAVCPRAAYSKSKYDAERYLIQLASDNFCPTILRKGTIYGFSPRMRFDLVVNTFVKDALSRGLLTLHHGGEMWRPLVDVRDVARAYIACLEANEDQIRGEIFNVSTQNVRISELALRVRETLHQIGIQVDIQPDYASPSAIRCYRVSSAKIECLLGIRWQVTLEQSVIDMVGKIRQYGYTDFENPKYYNIRWMQLMGGM